VAFCIIMFLAKRVVWAQLHGHGTRGREGRATRA
jgi:hypothetical protein